MRWRSDSVCFIFAMAGGAALMASVPVAAVDAGPASAVVRLQASIRAARGSSVRLRLTEAENRSRQVALLAEAAPGSPFVELQTEGRSASFDRKPNAADYLRFGTPFLFPWQSRHSRRLAESADLDLAASQREMKMAVVAEVGRLWLAAAAAAEQHAVVGRRLEAVDRALRLLNERLKHGEVAGGEVLQLELDRAREASRAAELESRRQALADSLLLRCGDGVQEPHAGDLQELADAVRSRIQPEQLLDRAAESPRVAAAASRAAVAEARASLVASTAFGAPEADVEWERIPQIDGMPGHDAMGLRLSVPLPLGRAGRLAREAAAAEALAWDAAAELAELEVVEELRQAAAAHDGAATRLAALAPGLERLAAAEHSLAEQVRLGAISSIVYLDVKSRLDDLRIESIAATLQLLESRLQMAVLLESSELFPLPLDDHPEVNP